MKFKERIGSFVILTQKNKTELFLVKRSDIPVWEIQGGGIEEKETPKQTAIRESYEETGFKIKIIRKVAEYYKDKVIRLHLFEGKVISGSFKKEYPECEGRWFDINNIPKDMINHKKIMIKDFLKNEKSVIKSDYLNLNSFDNLHLFLKFPVQSILFYLSKI